MKPSLTSSSEELTLSVRNSCDYKLYFDKQPPLEDAVNVAVRLLQTCQTRLEEVDKSIQAKDQVVEGWEDSLRKSRHEQSRLEQKFGNPVPFLKGLFYITKR